MPLSDYRTISRISSVGALGSVSVNGQTVPAYKCVVTNLENKILPSPDNGASYQGIAIVKDILTGQIGLFIMVAGNPSASSGGGLNAREVWLASWGAANWNSEFSTSFNALNVIAAPLVGQYIAFMPVTGASPQTANNIIPTGASGGCVSATLIDQRSLALAQDFINAIGALDTYQAVASSVFTPTTTAWFYTLIGNLVTLTPGDWLLNGTGIFDSNGAAVNYTNIRLLWSLANGANSTTSPGGLGGNLLAGFEDNNLAGITLPQLSTLPAQTVRVSITTNTAIYLVPFAQMGTPANARISTRIYAQRLT